MELFKTERLTVQYLENGDLEPFHDMQSNFKVMQFIKPEMNLEESQKELNRFMDYYHKEHINFNIWAVKEQHTNLFAGVCGVYENAKKEFEIAYRLRERFWGKGYGREMARGLIQYCFEQTDLDLLKGYVRAGNIGSIKILKQEMHYKYKFIEAKTQLEEQVYELRKEDWLMKN
jgi:ribosomal-protein-alanine N-acetyltransferase